jgi:trk system potassium uptake protein TrkA
MSIDCWREANAEGHRCAHRRHRQRCRQHAGRHDRRPLRHPRKIARVRSTDLAAKDSVLSAADLKIDLIIHPEELAAQEIVRLVKRTAGNEIIDIADGQTQVMATRVHEAPPWPIRS